MDANDAQYTFRANQAARVRGIPSTTGLILGSVPAGATVYSNEMVTGDDRLQWVKVTVGMTTLENGVQMTQDGYIRQDLLTLVYHKVPTGYMPNPNHETGNVAERVAEIDAMIEHLQKRRAELCR